MAGCEPVFVPLVPPDFGFDANVLEDAFKQGAKAILVCNPSNPSGKVFTCDELKIIADLCVKYDVYAIMDEVYEHIIYEGHKHTYMNSLPGMWERTASSSTTTSTQWAPPPPSWRPLWWGCTCLTATMMNSGPTTPI